LIFFVVSVTLAAGQAFAEQSPASCKFSIIYPPPFLISQITSVLSANQVADILMDQGLASAIEVVNSNSSDTFSFFGAGSYGTSKYKTRYAQHENVKLKGHLLLCGVAKRINLNCGRLLSGVFYAHDKISYDLPDTYDAYTKYNNCNKYETEGYYSKYNGCGLLGRFDFKNNLYGELSGRIGNIQTDIYALKYNSIPHPVSRQHFQGQISKCDSLCFVWHAGLGYLCKFSNSLGLDICGRYFFMRQEYKDIDKHIEFFGDKYIGFFDVDSKRLKLGAKLLYNPNSVFSFYGGGGYEYEFDGTVNVAIANESYNPLSTACFKGGTSVYELGMTANTGYFCIGLSLQKHTGLREGYSAAAKISVASLNFLGLSTEKFEKEETGQFEKIFNMSQKACFEKSLKIIKDLRARVVNKSLKKGYIVAFDFPKSFDCCLDSTEVCIFIANKGRDKVKVKVVSNNSSLAKDVSTKFFEMLGQE
jgi:hypothetical protein